MIRHLLTMAVTAVVALAAGVGLGLRLRPPLTPPPPPAPPAIERLREIGLLSTLIVDVADVRETTAHGRVGSARLLLILRGEAVLGVDLTQVTIVSSDPLARHAVIRLPLPTVHQAKVDTHASRVYRIDREGLWLIRPDDDLTTRMINAALADAQAAVRDTANRPPLRDLARRQAEQLLTRWAAAAGWTIEIRWRL